MNSGCFEREFKDIILSVQTIDTLGNVITIPRGKIKFDYRKCNLNNNLSNLDKQKEFMPNMLIYNLKDLNSFVNSKNSFENLSIFTYYPYKLFQEVLYE